MWLKEFDVAIAVHEITHVVFRLNKVAGLEINNDSQEWVAQMVEYIYSEYNKNNYINVI